MSLPGGMIEPPGSFAFSRMDKCMPAETKVCLQRPTGAHRTAPRVSGSHGLSGPSVGWWLEQGWKVPVAQRSGCQHVHIPIPNPSQNRALNLLDNKQNME